MPNLDTLVQLFYANQEDLADFEGVEAEQLPMPARRLLDHHEHMTETVEAYHGQLVKVEVLRHFHDDHHHYAREILLRRVSDHAVVQYGIVRLDFSYLQPDVCREIEGHRKPLGRVLIEHDVLRQVEMVALWRVNPGLQLRSWLGMEEEDLTYGRTAYIHCNGEPAVELLEIVTPT